MRDSRLDLTLDDLNVDTFATGETQQQVPIRLTVLYETEQLSCGGSCGTCPVCWA